MAFVVYERRNEFESKYGTTWCLTGRSPEPIMGTGKLRHWTRKAEIKLPEY